jgi:hypothetical protein
MHDLSCKSFAALHESGSDAVDGSSTRNVSAMDIWATKAPIIRRSYLCKQLRQLVSTSQNQWRVASGVSGLPLSKAAKNGKLS